MTVSFMKVLAACTAMAVAPGHVQPATARAQQPAGAPDPTPVPFAVGEKLTYDVKFGAVKVGTGEMEVLGTDSIRGREVYHTLFTLSGGTFFYKVNDRLESWFDTSTLSSLRFEQHIDEGDYERERHYEIYPDRAVFRQVGNEADKPSVSNPLDDGSFLYFIRTVPLLVGETYVFNRYFRPDRNPVKIRVLRRERVQVPAGTFDAVVIQPIIKTKGIFSDDGEAEIWLTDDSRRMMVQMKSKLSIGSLNLYLTSYRTPTTRSAAR